jgi:hypothetical protein
MRPSSILCTVLLVVTCAAVARPAPPQGSDMTGTIASLEKEFIQKYGETQRARAERGLRQAATLWRPGDGSPEQFAEFARAQFAGTPAELDSMFVRFEWLLEELDGHMTEIGRAFKRQSDLSLGPIMPFDEITAGYDPGAHLLDDCFANKLAFTVLLNFPLTTLAQRLDSGAGWTRRQWAEARLAQRFGRRIPADVQQAIARATARSDQYISGYNIWMHHVLGPKNERLFPKGLRLLSHWNLRDELKSHYGEGEGGLLKQRIILRVMERIVDQSIPAIVVDNPHVDWDPFTNRVSPAASVDAPDGKPETAAVSNAPEPDTRYAVLLETFLASKQMDPYSPAAPTLIARKFDEEREIPEARVRAMLESVLSSPMAVEVAGRLRARLGRPLEPFDIYYQGFRPRGPYSEEELDGITKKRYPTAAAFERDIPRILAKLGFRPERAALLAASIAVEPARGSGHASGAAMRSAKALLRTRVEADGMNYKGYNIAVHELGHNVEQVISLGLVDHTLLQGVPNTAFTEALAFVFQERDLELLDLPAAQEDEALTAIHDFWMTYEIAGVALLDMDLWHWMYDHPAATPAELKAAALASARAIWNRFYAPVLGMKDETILAIYSHIIHSFLYLPDYPLGHLIAFQVDAQVRRSGSVGPEFERMATAGRIVPDLWMKNATGSPVGAEALLEATARALRKP